MLILGYRHTESSVEYTMTLSKSVHAHLPVNCCVYKACSAWCTLTLLFYFLPTGLF